MKETKENKKMKKILRYLLLTMCLLGILRVNVYAAENTDRVINLTGISHVKIYTADKKREIEVKDKSFTVTPGEYCYEYAGDASNSLNGAGGYFTVTEDTTELKLESVYFKNVSPTAWLDEMNFWGYLPDLGTLSLYDEKQQKEYWHATDDVYDYVVPNCGGDSYYNFKFR